MKCIYQYIDFILFTLCVLIYNKKMYNLLLIFSFLHPSLQIVQRYPGINYYYHSAEAMCYFIYLLSHMKYSLLCALDAVLQFVFLMPCVNARRSERSSINSVKVMCFD